jgi:hypothetical protein
LSLRGYCSPSPTHDTPPTSDERAAMEICRGAGGQGANIRIENRHIHR